MLLVAAYWRTKLTMRQIAALFGTSKSAADRIIDDLAPKLALRPRKRYAPETVLIVDGTLVPTRDHTVAAKSKNCAPPFFRRGFILVSNEARKGHSSYAYPEVPAGVDFCPHRQGSVLHPGVSTESGNQGHSVAQVSGE